MTATEHWRITSADEKASVEIVGDSLVFNEKTTAAALLAGRGMQGHKSISIRNITAIQIKRGGFLSPGYINFSYLGGKEFKGGLMEATRDPDTLIYNAARNDAVQAFADEVERRRAHYQDVPAATVSSLAEEVEKLMALKTAGALTDDEFTIAKRKLLERLSQRVID